MKPSNNSEYNFTADVIRALAIFGVVSIHVVVSIYNRPDFQGGTVWIISNFWNAISRASIPLFIMLSGFLLIPKHDSWSKNRHRIISRLLIPLLFWFLWYRFWRQGYMSYQDFRVSSLVKSLIFGDVGFLYFLVIMLGLYSLLPFLQKHFPRLTQYKQLVIITVLLSISVIITFFNYSTGRFIFNNSFLMWFPYLGFFLAGHVLSKIKFSTVMKLVLFIIYVSSVFVTAYLNDFSLTQLHAGNKFYFPPRALSSYFEFYLSPNVVIMSLTAFSLLISQNFNCILRSKIITQWIKRIATASFGMYLIHLMIVNFIEVTLGLGVDFVRIPLLIYLVIKFLCVFVGAYFATIILKRIPMLRKTLGEK